MSELQDTDVDVYNAIQNEEKRELEKILLIASENCVSKAVLEAQGSIFTNKYAEGYPNRRYYGGCQFADAVETLAIERAKQLFGCEHVNVQPHSGSSANMAVYFSVLQPGDTILGMALPHGGHLTHGASVSFSGQLYKAFSYHVDKKTELLDYDEVERLAMEHKPKMIVAGYSAYSRVLDFARFRKIADKVGAYLMADIAHIAGLVAAGEHPSPVPHADFVTTTTHKTLRGPRGGMIMCKEKFAKAVDKVIFPGIQGGPLVHVIAAKAVSFKEALMPEFKEYQRQVDQERQGARGASYRGRLPHRFGRHGQSPHARRPDAEEHYGQGRRDGARCGRHHGEQEQHPLGPEAAGHHERNPARHSAGHHARHEGAGDEDHRRSHLRDPRERP